MSLSSKEIAEKHIPINTTCPFKIKKAQYQREQLAKDIDEAIRNSKTELRETASNL